MRVLILAEMMDSSVASFRIRKDLARKLAEWGHKVTFVHPSTCRRLLPKRTKEGFLTTICTPGLAPVEWRRGGFGLLDMICKIVWALGTRPNVIHVTCGHRPAQLVPSIVGRLCGAATLDEWWEWYGAGGRADRRTGGFGWLMAEYDRRTELPTKGMYDGVIAIATALKDRVERNGHIEVIPGGVESHRITPVDRLEARLQMGLSEDLFIVGLVGVGEADHEDNLLFLDAFERLSREYPKLRLVVSGDKRYAAKRILSRSFSGQVVSYGWVKDEDYSRLLGVCDLFALPLRNTPRNAGRWPHKLGDFMAADRPVLTNATGDVGDWFKRYSLGVLCDESAEGFYEAMNAILSGRVDLRALHRDSVRVAREILSWERRAKTIERIYHQLVSERRRR